MPVKFTDLTYRPRSEVRFNDLTFEDVIFMEDLSEKMKLKYQIKSSMQRVCYRLDLARSTGSDAVEVSRLAGEIVSQTDSVEADLQVGSVNPLNLIRNANAALTNFDNVAKTANDMLLGVTSVIDQVKNLLFGSDQTGMIKKVCSIIVNACLAGKRFVASLLFNVTMEFGGKMISKLISLINPAKPKVYRMEDAVVPAYLQADGKPDESVLAQLANTIVAHRGLTAATVGAIIAILLQLVLGLPNVGDIDKALKFFGDRSRSLTNIVNFHSVAIPMFTSIGDYIVKKTVGGIQEESELDDYLSGYNRWANDVLGLVQLDPPFITRIEREKELVFQCDRLFKQSVEYSCLIGQKKLPATVVLHYQKIAKIIEELRRMCDNTGVFGNRPRTKPLVVQLFGESGVGKSGMTWPLASDLNAVFSDDITNAQQFARETYFRNTEQEFWDGYTGQTVVVYDDFGQRADSQASPNEEFMEIIRTANLAPYPLHMASLEEKRRTKFCSKVVILTSNVLNQNVNSLTFPEAYRRRIDICAKVTNKEEYTSPRYSASKQMVVPSLDRLKCNGPVDTSPYLMEIYDAQTMSPKLAEDGSPILMEYEDFVDLCIKVAKSSFEDSQLMNGALDKRIDTERFARLKAKLQIGDFLTGASLQVGGRKPCYSGGIPSLDATDSEEEYVDVSEQKTYNFDLDDPLTLPLSKRQEFVSYMKKKSVELKSVLKESLKKFVSEMTLLKATIIMVGLALAGLGVWKWMSVKEETPKVASVRTKHPVRSHFVVEGNQSSDCLTTKPTRVVIENNQSGDNITPVAKTVVVEGNQSSDCMTAKTTKVVVEANQSGDCSTAKPKTVIVEGNQSSDSMTKAYAKVVVEGDDVADMVAKVQTEANVSGDPHTRSMKNIRMEANVDAEMEAWKDVGAQELISNRILGNLYKVSRIRNGVQTDLLNGLFVRDTLMLVPRHLIGYITPQDHILIENMTNSRFEMPFSACKVEYIRSRHGADFDKDACLIQFPKYVNAHADIVKHFQIQPELNLRCANVCLPTIRKSKEHRMFTILGNTEAKFKPITLDTPDGTFNIRDSIEYTLNTTSGDCGGPVIVNENSVLRKICGIHIAGASDGTRSFGQSITRNDLEETMKLFGKVVITDAELMDNFTVCKVDLQCDKEYSQTDIKSLLGLAADTFYFLGGVTKSLSNPAKSDIRPSVIHGYTETTTKPAILRHLTVDIMAKNLTKSGVNTPFIPENEISKAVSEVSVKLLKNANPLLKRVLTVEEGVEGNTALSQFMCPMNRSSSAGYPWVLYKESGKVGKTQWLGEDAYILTEDVKKAVHERIQLAKCGVRKPAIWTDTLKDERRPIEKVDALKTRVFSNGPMDYTIAFRMYFLAFMAHVMENRIENEQSIGTNAFGYDWTRTARYLRSRGQKVFAGDFSTFDGTLNSCIMHVFLGVINKFYDDGEENAMIREVLFKDVYNSIHLCNGQFYGTTHSQPSGNPITTILNSFYNSVSMRVSYYRCAANEGIKPAPKFEEACAMVSYGDDNVVNFRDTVATWFNQIKVTEAFESFGMIYTDEGKTGEIVAHRDLTEVAYLKRKFRFDGCYWRAPLDLAVIKETPQWIRKCPEEKLACIQNVEMCVRELAQHDRVVFDEWSDKIVRAVYDATREYPEVYSYETYVEEWNSDMM